MRLRASIIAAILLALSRPAAAAMPPGSEIRVGPTLDLASITKTISSRYAVTIRRALTADIDRDGDLDLLTASDIGFDVWVNDGAGRLTALQPPAHAPATATAPADTWRDSDSRPDPPAPSPIPSFTGCAKCSHAPPAQQTAVRTVAPARDQCATLGLRAPRAPPAFAR